MSSCADHTEETLKSTEHRIAPLAQTLWVLGEMNTVKAQGENFTLFESVAFSGGGWPPHVHRGQDEEIYVLEGEYALAVGGAESRLEPGSFASVPRGMVHALKVVGEGQGRCLKIFTPRGDMEMFLEEVGIPVGNGVPKFLTPPDIEEVFASARRHGIQFLTKSV